MMIFADDFANSAKYTGFRTNQHLIKCWFVQNPVYLAELAKSSAKIINESLLVLRVGRETHML